MFTCFATRSFCQQLQKELLPQQSIQAKIASGETHRYTLKLSKAQFVTLTLMQKGVDLVVTTFDEQGKKLQEYDSPNGTYGAEPFTISSTQAGNYTIEVAPLEKNVQGNYELKINHIKPKAVTPSQQVDEAFSIWDNAESPGAAVSIMRHGKTLYKKGYGLANLEYAIPNSPETIFHVASVSKQFTAFSILLLAQEGKLSLDDDIRKYIPEMHDFGKKITLRHLASHTSGLRDQWELLVLAGWRIDDVITQDQILK
ncbi:MAG TPA: serine hydrolase, partial [Chitinophagaceae bacterium]|nr:serine hydrolase [Chitinophagaceae bacterium]